MFRGRLIQHPLSDIVRRVEGSVDHRAEVHAALGDTVRLALVDELASSDRSPGELAAALSLPGNLLAHHLNVLERVGLVQRRVSSGDRRRRYVTLRTGALDALSFGPAPSGRRLLFVCTHNSARSQLAAALWRQRTGGPATSAGTHPAPQVHPGAVAAAHRAGIDLGDARPRRLRRPPGRSTTVVTVCDRAHEELDVPRAWLHWSVPDPVELGTADAFDATVAELGQRIDLLTR
jgi:ArsR family transcriptional regulator, arsenate/arsenite/antimonite-responsive transcriptional repressor / arsenate reductase (thioredoxin)